MSEDNPDDGLADFIRQREEAIARENAAAARAAEIAKDTRDGGRDR